MDEKKIDISVDGLEIVKKEDVKKELGIKSTKYVQSANSLFHFTNKIRYLKEEIKGKCMVPRYCEEDASFLNLDNLQTIAYPMICFCDIKLHNIFSHAEYYGHYAIAFSKDFGIKNNIQPIMYLNINSQYCTSLQKAFRSYTSDIDDTSYEIIADTIIYTISYIKPLEGQQKGITKNFHDEQEWRFIPDVAMTEMPYFIINASERNKYLENLNNTLMMIDKVKLKFEYNDIQYLFVNKQEDRDELISFIIRLSISEEEKYLLISKISVLNTIEGDL